MEKLTSPLALLILSAAFALWLVTEVVAKVVVGAVQGRERWWGRLVVGATPYVIGPVLMALPGLFTTLMDIFGYMPKHPPEGIGASAYGVFAAFGATALHATGLGPLLRDLLRQRLVPLARRLGTRSPPEDR